MYRICDGQPLCCSGLLATEEENRAWDRLFLPHCNGLAGCAASDCPPPPPPPPRLPPALLQSPSQGTMVSQAPSQETMIRMTKGDSVQHKPLHRFRTPEKTNKCSVIPLWNMASMAGLVLQIRMVPNTVSSDGVPPPDPLGDCKGWGIAGGGGVAMQLVVSSIPAWEFRKGLGTTRG